MFAIKEFDSRFANHFFINDISLTVIRPTEPLRLNLQKFTSDDIGRLIVQGYKAGTDKLRTT